MNMTIQTTMLGTDSTMPLFRPADDLLRRRQAKPGSAQEIIPRQVLLRDRTSVATLYPFFNPQSVPQSLLVFLCGEMNKEIQQGDSYPMIEPFTVSEFVKYWFSGFAAVMIRGEDEAVVRTIQTANDQTRWGDICLGSFFIQAKYPGRSSHICTGLFLVTTSSRKNGVGRLMGEMYLDWAPKLAYTYSLFDLVYEKNTSSCRIWDSLGFKRLGRIKGCGYLKSYPDHPVDAIIYGRDLTADGDEDVTEERFDKIKYYVRHGKYPNGADRAEKSRLRSAATHYKLIPATDNEPERLMLKDKEVVAEADRQMEIARQFHIRHNHGGINKTTASLAEKYHWIRIKETVSHVIRVCPECNESAKQPAPGRMDIVTPTVAFGHHGGTGPILGSTSNLPPGAVLIPSQMEVQMMPTDRAGSEAQARVLQAEKINRVAQAMEAAKVVGAQQALAAAGVQQPPGVGNTTVQQVIQAQAAAQAQAQAIHAAQTQALQNAQLSAALPALEPLVDNPHMQQMQLQQQQFQQLQLEQAIASGTMGVNSALMPNSAAAAVAAAVAATLPPQTSSNMALSLAPQTQPQLQGIGLPPVSQMLAVGPFGTLVTSGPGIAGVTTAMAMGGLPAMDDVTMSDSFSMPLTTDVAFTSAAAAAAAAGQPLGALTDAELTQAAAAVLAQTSGMGMGIPGSTTKSVLPTPDLVSSTMAATTLGATPLVAADTLTSAAGLGVDSKLMSVGSLPSLAALSPPTTATTLGLSVNGVCSPTDMLPATAVAAANGLLPTPPDASLGYVGLQHRPSGSSVSSGRLSVNRPSGSATGLSSLLGVSDSATLATTTM